MDYPQDFPAESQAKVVEAKILAGRKFDSDSLKAEWRSDIEALFWIYVLTPFLVFADQACRLRLWPVAKMDEECQEFLRRLMIDAHYEKGKSAGLPDPISNWNGSILWKFEQRIGKTPQWQEYQNILLNAAKPPMAKKATRMPGSVTNPTAAKRMESYIKSKGLSQTQFAIQVGTTDRTIRAFRQTGKVRRDIFVAIAKALGVTADELMATR